ITANSRNGTESWSEAVPDAPAVLYLVLAFQQLVAGFGARHLPLIEHDPLALRPLAERMFWLLLHKQWALPIVSTCETAARLWGSSDAEPLSLRRASFDSADVAPDRPALDQSMASFLRHRMRRYAEKHERLVPEH